MVSCVHGRRPKQSPCKHYILTAQSAPFPGDQVCVSGRTDALIGAVAALAITVGHVERDGLILLPVRSWTIGRKNRVDDRVG